MSRKPRPLVTIALVALLLPAVFAAFGIAKIHRAERLDSVTQGQIISTHLHGAYRTGDCSIRATYTVAGRTYTASNDNGSASYCWGADQRHLIEVTYDSHDPAYSEVGSSSMLGGITTLAVAGLLLLIEVALVGRWLHRRRGAPAKQ